MKNFLAFVIALTLLGSCIPTNKPLREAPKAQLDPFVQNWFQKPAALTSEKIAVLVVAKEALSGYGFLKHTKGNYYTGHVTRDQLKLLLNDPRIVRISGGEQKLPHHKSHH